MRATARTTALEDQQLGGLIMWVPGGIVYGLVAVWLGYAWLDRDVSEAGAGWVELPR